MVIINTQNAQLANRLWGFASFIANSIEYNYPLKNIGFHRYLAYFEATSKNNFDGYPISVKRSGIAFLDHFYSNLFKTWSSFTYRKFGKTPTLYPFYRTQFNEDKRMEIFDLNRADFVSDAQKKTILVQGWMFRDAINVRKHREKIIQFFKPVAPFLNDATEAVKMAKAGVDVLVGVHIRRGDYATFVGGKWFFSNEQYARMMTEIAKAYQIEGKSCSFFICSNEDVDLKAFKNLNMHTAKRHFMVDLYALAACDAIIGPPSTYSQWAAYYGNKPLTMILNGDQTLGIPQYNPTFVANEDFPEKNLYRF